MSTILHVTRIFGVGGTENMIKQICEATKNRFERIIMCSANGGGVNDIEQYVDKYYEIMDCEDKNPLKIWKAIRQIKNIIQKEAVDIIHVHHRMSAFIVNMASAGMNIPRVYNAHTIHDDKKKITKRILSKYNLLVADGDRVKDNLIDFFHLDEGIVKIIYNTVKPYDGRNVHIDQIEKQKGEGKTIVGTVARLSYQKGIDVFIKAVGKVNNKNIAYFIIGDGEQREEMQELVRKLKLDEKIFFLGFMDNIKAIIKEIDVLVLSSRWEGLPLTLLEAFSVHKPVIASNINGNNEVIINEHNGLLFESEDSGVLAEKIDYAVLERSKWDVLGENAYQDYMSLYSFEIFKCRYNEIYEMMGF